MHENEGYPYEQNIQEWVNEFQTDALESVTCYSLWGNKQYELISQTHPLSTQKLKVTGSLRLAPLAKAKYYKQNNTIPCALIALSSTIAYPRYQTRVQEFHLWSEQLGYPLDSILQNYVDEIADVERCMHIASSLQFSLHEKAKITMRPHPY